jgi:hypothetical protein
MRSASTMRIAVLLLTLGAAPARAQDISDPPPLDPDADETRLERGSLYEDGQKMIEGCLSVTVNGPMTEWAVGPALLTHSARWGFIARMALADSSGENESRFKHRLICWENPETGDNGVIWAIGQQDMKPLFEESQNEKAH